MITIPGDDLLQVAFKMVKCDAARVLLFLRAVSGLKKCEKITKIAEFNGDLGILEGLDFSFWIFLFWIVFFLFWTFLIFCFQFFVLIFFFWIFVLGALPLGSSVLFQSTFQSPHLIY